METIVAYKGFDKDWKCRGFQYEVGMTYTHEGKVEACVSGFHACECPMDVFSYYDICDSKYAVVELSGDTDKHGDDTKIAAAFITIKAEINLTEIVKKTIEWVRAFCDKDEKTQSASGYGSKLAASGKNSVALAAYDARLKVGENGAMCGAWTDKNGRPRLAVAYEGENGIKRDTWYRVNGSGVFVKAD